MNRFTALHLATKCFALNSGERDEALTTRTNVCAHALLGMLKDVPEQELFKRLQLPKQSGVSRLPLAL
jgi:hypothetical protein